MRSYDGKTLVMRVIAWSDAAGHTLPLSEPRRRYITLQGDTKLCRRDAPDQPLLPADIKPGEPILVIGPDRGSNHGLPARLVAAEPPVADTQAFASHRAPSPPDDFATRNSVRPRAVAPAVKRDRVLTTAELELVNRINDYRREFKLEPVSLDVRLSAAAWNHARDLSDSKNLSQTGSDGSTPASRVRRAGYTASIVQENDAMGYAMPEAVLRAWITHDAESRRALLNPNIREIGVAFVSIPSESDSTRHADDIWTLVLAAPE